MKSKWIWVNFLLLAIFSCKPEGKSEVADILGFDEPKDWILVIHPEGCKTCLDSFYDELLRLSPRNDGAIVIIAKNSKNLRMIPLIEKPPIPLYLDENKKLIREGIVELEDQILVFKEKSIERFDILEYQNVFQALPYN